MPPAELRARESFYGRMFWIVNGEPFRDRFDVLSPLPDPAEEWVRDLVLCEPKAGRSDMFWLKSEHPDRKPDDLVLIRSWNEIEDQIARSCVGHYLCAWKQPRTVGYEATANVLLDLGGPMLWRLAVYHDRLRCEQAVEKERIVSESGGTYVAGAADVPRSLSQTPGSRRPRIQQQSTSTMRMRRYDAMRSAPAANSWRGQFRATARPPAMVESLLISSGCGQMLARRMSATPCA